MRKITADSMIKALERFKQYLLIDEWMDIQFFLYSLVENNNERNNNFSEYKRNEEPPLKAAWNKGWSTSINTPIIIHIGLFLLGMAIGYWGF